MVDSTSFKGEITQYGQKMCTLLSIFFFFFGLGVFHGLGTVCTVLIREIMILKDTVIFQVNFLFSNTFPHGVGYDTVHSINTLDIKMMTL